MTELKKITQQRWRAFLGSESGMEGMLYLREKVPGVSPAGDVTIIFQAGRAEGFKQAIDTISDLIAGEKETKNEDIENK